MNETQTILLIHRDRYPSSQLEDYLKLLYQNTYGPRHFSSNPSIPEISAYLEEEFRNSIYDPRTPLIEDIGGGFVRVSLENLRQGTMSLRELALAFWKTMNLEADEPRVSEGSFREKAEDLLVFIHDGKIPLKEEACRQFLHEYVQEGIRPIHHSRIYNESYHPHYRVVHQTFLTSR